MCSQYCISSAFPCWRSASFRLARQGKALHRRCAAEGYPYFTYLDFFDILEAFGAPLPKPIAAPAAAPAA